jgi:hypothetical protein
MMLARMHARRRRGIALLLALLLLTLLGIQITGAVSTTAVRFRTARGALVDGALDAAAVSAIGAVLRDPLGFGLADLPLGVATTIALPPVAFAGNAPIAARIVVTRFGRGIIWMLAQSQPLPDTTAGERRLGVVLRYPSIGDPPPAVIVARGDVSLDASVIVSADSGGDADCARAVPSAASVQRTDSSAFFLTAAQLASLDSSPSVRHVRGDTTVSGGTFDGILVVDGRLTIDGPWSATGLVIVRGAVRSPGGLSLTGALLSFADGPQPAVLLSDARLRFSPCTVARALRIAFPPRLSRPRAWGQAF